MNLVEVDPIGLQPTQAVIDRLDEPAPRVATAVGSLAHLEVPLRRQHDVVSPRSQRLADDRLGLAVGVHVRGVDEVDAGVERGVDNARAVVVIAVADEAEHHRSEALRADLDARSAEAAVAHRQCPPPCLMCTSGGCIGRRAGVALVAMRPD
jgi:hypothetical protein